MVGDDISAVDNKFKVFLGGVTANLTFVGLLSFTDFRPRISFHKLRPDV